jgi:glucosamine-phosphate N-acetyltransferase
MSLTDTSNKLVNLNLDKKAQDLANNNHIDCLEQKLKFLSVNKCDYNLFDSSVYCNVKPANFKFQYEKFELKHSQNKSSLTTEYWFDLGSDLIMRPLQRDDFNKNYMTLLSQLTEIGNVTKEDYENRFDKMKSSLDTYYINVIEDLSAKRIVASLTLVYEQKFIRNTSARGRIEDVVVDKDYRGKQLSKMLLDISCQLSSLLGCYKLSLECKDPLKKLYEQFEFCSEQGQNYLCRRFVAKI